MMPPYTPKDAAETLGVSSSALRGYCTRYAAHLTTEATNTPRTFRPDDMRLLSFVVAQTRIGQTHAAILAMLADDAPEWAAWSWSAPDADTPIADETSTALVPVHQLYAARALLDDAQRREAAAAEDLQAARERIAALERELGRAEGELAARRRPWWARILGR